MQSRQADLLTPNLFFASNLQDPTKAVLVHWKPEKLKIPIFRQAVWTFDGLSASGHKALRFSTFAYYLDRLGWAVGFAQKLTSYCFRRGTGNAVDGAAKTAVRDQVMRHNPQTGVFCGFYISEKVRFIVQDAVLDQPTNIGFLRAFTHMSLTCDLRAPIDVPGEVLKTLPPDPEIMEHVEPVVHHQFPERTQLQEVLCDLSRDMSPSDIVRCRIRTIDLMVALSRRQEQEVQHSNHSSRESSDFSEEQPLCEDPFPLLCKKT